MASYDLVVIGTGPGGYVCAVRAAQLGMKVAVPRVALGFALHDVEAGIHAVEHLYVDLPVNHLAYGVLDRFDRRIEAFDMADHQGDAGPLRRGDDLLPFGDGGRDRFLDQLRSARHLRSG